MRSVCRHTGATEGRLPGSTASASGLVGGESIDWSSCSLSLPDVKGVSTNVGGLLSLSSEEAQLYTEPAESETHVPSVSEVR